MPVAVAKWSTIAQIEKYADQALHMRWACCPLITEKLRWRADFCGCFAELCLGVVYVWNYSSVSKQHL